MKILRNLDVTTGGRRILGVPDVGILAATIASETSTGTNGPGLLYDESINPANAGKYLRIRITTPPSAGSLFVYENGAFDFSGAADGSYTIGYDWYADDVLGGSDSASILVGVVNGAAAGSTLTGTSTLTPGTAQGTSTGDASGTTLTGSSTISAGAATGTSAGTASGATLTGTSSLTAGAAIGSTLMLTQADIDAIAQAVLNLINSTTGFRTLGQHLQIQTAVLAGNESGAGSGQITYADGTTVVTAEVPLPGQVGNRTGVIISGV